MRLIKNNSRQKLLIFPGNYVPHIGGLETHVDEFAKRYSKFGKVTIFTPLIKDAPVSEVLHNSVKVIRYPSFELVNQYFIPRFWSVNFWKLFFSLRDEKFDWVMTRTLFFANSTLGLLFARLNKIKLIHVEHGSDFPQSNNLLIFLMSRFYLFFFGNIHTRLSDVLVGVSNGSKSFLEKNFWIKKPVHVIRRGFDESILDVREKKLKSLSVVYVGRLVEGKGVHDLLNATINDNYNIYLIGEGGFESYLRGIAKKSSCKIHFLGKIPHKDVISYLKGCDVFVNPSYTEGLPTSVLDALFSGAKVIATDVGGTKEILGDDWSKLGHRLIEPRNIEELNKAIKEVLFEKKDDVKGFKKLFNWDNHIKDYKKLLD